MINQMADFSDIGSNADGSWMRFSNGIQICWQDGLSTGSWAAYGSVRRAISATLTFPKPFSETPVVTPSYAATGAYDSYGLWYVVRSLSAVSCIIQSYTDSVSHTANYLQYLAIGRWK